VARREILVAIAALVLWVLTAAAGLVLLTAGSAAKRAGAEQAAAQQAAPVPSPPVTAPAPATAAAPAGPAAPAPAHGPAAPAAGPAGPPPIPRVKVHATPGEHPLLEFSHPLLGLIGLGVWFVFVGTRHAPLAWVSFGILVAAIAAGVSWLARNTLAARRGDRPARAGFPKRLVLLHGFTASATFVLAVLTALTASHF
jgi:hypothetical protein